MKALKLFGSLIILSILSSGCKSEKSENPEKTLSAGKNDVEVVEDFDFKEQAVEYDIYDTTWEQEVYTYLGAELQIKFEIATIQRQAEFSLLVFIDGVLTPYCSNMDSVYSERQIFKTEIDEKKSDYIIYFKPLYGREGETYDLEVLLLDNPEYMLKDTSWLSFAPNHSTVTISKKKLDYQSDTNENNDISNIYEVRDLTDEVEKKFDNDYAKGGNNLNETIFFSVAAKPIDMENEKEESKGYFSMKKGEKLKLYLPFLGLDGDYRVSIYINYEQIAAFDDKNYLDVKVQRDKYTEKVIEIDVSEYSGLNHIEMFIADLSGPLHVLGSGPTLLEITE